MKDINTKLYELVESLVRDNLHHKYNDNYNKFMSENGTLILFVEQNKSIIVNEKVRIAIMKLINNDEYLDIVNRIKVENRVNTNESNEQQQNNNVDNNDANISFVPLGNAQAFIQNENDQEIYNKAINTAMSPDYSHNLFIGVRDNHLEPIVKDENNNLVDLEKNNVKKMTLSKTNNQGFSNALILAFVIGSFIGILFLNIYSRFMK